MILMPAGRALFAAGKGAAGASRVATYLGFIHGNPGGDLSQAGFSIGTASADRVIVAALTDQSNASGKTVIVNGVTLTQRVTDANTWAAIYTGIVPTGTSVTVSTTHTSFGDVGLVLWSVSGVASATPKATAASVGIFSTGASIAVDAGDFLMAGSQALTDWSLGAATEALTQQRATEGSGYRVGGAYKLGIVSANAAFHVGDDAAVAVVTF